MRYYLINLALLLLTSSVAADCKIYDVTLFLDKPVNTGMQEINVWYFHNKKPVNSTGRWVIDREDLPMVTEQDVLDNSIAYAQTMNDFKADNPDAKVGFYQLFPNRQYWLYPEWYRVNAMMQPLADQVDYIDPSLYTFYDNVGGWVNYAIANIKEARQYGKKVYPFLWMYYHDSNALLGGTEIDRNFWRTQLETVCKYADGVVIWGGWQKEWDDNAGWWEETQLFINN